MAEEISPKIENLMLKSLKNEMHLFLIINNMDKLYKLNLSIDEIQNYLISVFMKVNKVILHSDCLNKENKSFDFTIVTVAFGSVKNNRLLNVLKMLKLE